MELSTFEETAGSSLSSQMVKEPRARHRCRHHHTTASDQQEDEPSEELLYSAMVVILSGLYGIMLVVVGFVLPVTEALCDARSMQTTKFEVFYIYLYVVSMLFMLYVYTYLLRKNDVSLARTFSKKLSRSRPGKKSVSTESKEGSTSQSGQREAYTENGGWQRKHKIAFISSASNHTGSFYLRVGAVGFGLGSMIHSALTFGHFFEITQSGHPCAHVLQAMKPFTHVCFTFVQMYFVFTNSKMCIHKYQSLARFGLMHMCGTNVCVWLRSVVVETLHVIKVKEREDFFSKLKDHYPQLHNDVLENDTSVEQFYESGHLPELKCHTEAVFGKILASSSVYLFPCTIVYSLICAGVLCVMWSNIGEKGKRPNSPITSATDQSVPSDVHGIIDDRKTQRISVDCAGSSQGLFLGIALFVVALCCLIWFYVVIEESEKHLVAGSLIGHISEDFIYIVTIIALIIAAFQMKDMHFSLGLNSGIEEILTLVSLSGLGLFGIFSIVASMFYLDTLDGKLTVVTNIIMLIQAGFQATFMLVTLGVSAVDNTQAKHKPGRNCVTFLLVSNFTLWVLNTFETQSLEHNVVQVEFYGASAWSIFTHISVPLGIYYRFHSTVCLSNIWKNAWKSKEVPS